MKYTPRPIDTENVTLSADLVELTERLAENAHDVWALQRIAQGWTWGEERDDKTKTHPDLMPYANLPESEKEFDRSTAMETLKAIIALGYSIARREP
ncbi:MAG TPA: RyR domain-containing protein [bacterium]|nr:RyR domain-containing protein [bacterium]